MPELNPTRNVELLERTMQHIDDHPEAHDQCIWVNDCGSAACFAGWAALIHFGPSVCNGAGGYQLPSPYGDPLPNGAFPPMSFQAARLLGLTMVEANTLFSASNTPEMLRLMVTDLTDGRTLRSEEEYELRADAL